MRGLTLLVLAVGLLAPRAPAGADDAEALAGLTRRWDGATCVLRFAMPIQPERDEQGWSPGLAHKAALERGKAFFVRPRISDLAQLRARIGADEVPPGTAFLVEGWRPGRWGLSRGYVLDLRFRDLPLAGRFEFIAEFGFSLKPRQLSDIERWVKIEVCEVTFPSEALPPRPVAAASGAPAVPGAPTAASAPASAFAPALHVLAASVQPARARAGEEIALMINYLLEGLPAGVMFEAVEERELLSGERSLAKLVDRLPRAAGTYTSSQRIRVPDDLAAGLYRLRARVRMAGLEGEAEALFAVE